LHFKGFVTEFVDFVYGFATFMWFLSVDGFVFKCDYK